MLSSAASAKALASAVCAEVPKALLSALAEAANFLQVFEFKRFFNAKNITLLFIIIYLQYFLSDGTLIDFIKQLVGWIIIPLLTNILNKKSND